MECPGGLHLAASCLDRHGQKAKVETVGLEVMGCHWHWAEENIPLSLQIAGIIQWTKQAVREKMRSNYRRADRAESLSIATSNEDGTVSLTADTNSQQQ